nr:cytochrome c biogenesis protein CcsA [Candidatus Synchoanobacter obligatus]
MTLMTIFITSWICWFVPADETQGEVFRLIYLHVPMAIGALLLYLVVAGCSIMHWVLRIKVADWIASASAKMGATCCALALMTGSVWGYYTWGTWWVWDARLTSFLMLFFLYLAYIAVDRASQKHLVSKQVLMIVSLIGVVDIPLIHYSVTWWQSLHQGSTLLRLSDNTMPWDMLWPLLMTIVLSALIVTSFIARSVLHRSGHEPVSL